MCTTFAMQNSHSVWLGQNYDFYYGHGLIVASTRGWKKTALPSGEGMKPVHWISKYGNVTFTQFGRELPMSGMNEHGLVVAMMHHEDGQFPETDDRPVLNELQWIQYQLDRYSSVEEVIDHLDEIRLEKSIYVLHYMAADRTGKLALIEFVNGRAEVVERSQHITSTNTSYQTSEQYARRFRQVPTKQLSKDAVSLDRYTLADRMVETVYTRHESSPVPMHDAFEILQEVSCQPSSHDAWNWTGNHIPPSQTYWSIVFDVRNRAIHYKDQNNSSIRTIELDGLCFDVSEPVRAIRLDNSLSGTINDEFRAYTTDQNEHIIRLSFQPLTDVVSAEEQLELARYPDTFEKAGQS